MTTGLWPEDHARSRLTEEQRLTRFAELILIMARRKRASDGQPILTELVRAAFDEERPAFLALVREWSNDASQTRKLAASVQTPPDPNAGATSHRLPSSPPVQNEASMRPAKLPAAGRDEPDWVRRARGRS